MNAIPVSPSDSSKENGGGSGHGTDTDSDTEESPDYYQPISATGDEDSGSDSDQANSNGGMNFFNSYSSNLHNYVPDGYANGVASLTINDDLEEKSSEEDKNEEESATVAVQRAFREDEIRRSAPLRPENASRVLEAMRGVSFAGTAPSWAEALSEDQWIERLRNLRRPSGNPS